MNQKEIDAWWAEVVKLTAPKPAQQFEYRLYYNKLGEITGGSSTTDTLPTEPYVVVTKQEYERYFDYRIVNGRLKKIDRDSSYRVQLERSKQGYCVVKNHAGLILEPTESYTDTEYYGHRNN